MAASVSVPMLRSAARQTCDLWPLASWEKFNPGLSRSWVRNATCRHGRRKPRKSQSANTDPWDEPSKRTLAVVVVVGEEVVLKGPFLVNWRKAPGRTLLHLTARGWLPRRSPAVHPEVSIPSARGATAGRSSVHQTAGCGEETSMDREPYSLDLLRCGGDRRIL
jgi:hypothetical protein